MASSPSAAPSAPARGAPKVDFMSDEDLEKDWKPNARRPQSYVVPSINPLGHPLMRLVLQRDTQTDRCRPPVSSTIARSFSAELEDIFRIDNSVADLDAKLDERCVALPKSASPPHDIIFAASQIKEKQKKATPSTSATPFSPHSDPQLWPLPLPRHWASDPRDAK